MNINEALNTCLSNMKASDDFNDEATVNSIKDLLSCMIENPAGLIGFEDEEELSVALSCVLACQFPSDYPTFKDINVRNLIFATSYYLFMHQLETGRFYDKDWPAFITLIHYGRNEFAKFIVDTNPFAPEKINEITGRPFDKQRSLNAAKGLLTIVSVTKESADEKSSVTLPVIKEVQVTVTNAGATLTIDGVIQPGLSWVGYLHQGESVTYVAELEGYTTQTKTLTVNTSDITESVTLVQG